MRSFDDSIDQQSCEDFVRFEENGNGGNLTPLQREYTTQWRLAKPMQRGGQKWDCMTMGFRGGRPHLGGSPVVLDPDHPIQPVQAVRVLGLLPLPMVAVYAAADRRSGAAYRLHFAELAPRVEHGTVTFSVDANHKAIQGDAGKFPRQDHQRYRMRGVAPELMGAPVDARDIPPVDLAPPIAGILTVRRDDLHFRVMVEGSDVFRFRVEDAEQVQLSKTSGPVERGEIIGQAPSSLQFQEGLFTETGEPDFVYIGGDVLPASRRHEHLDFVNKSMAAMNKYALADLAKAFDLPYVADLAAVLPRHWVQFPADVLEDRYARGWRPNATFHKLLCQTLSPEAKDGSDSHLAIRSPIRGVVASISRTTVSEDRRDDLLELVFVDHDGREHRRTVPGAAVLSAKLQQLLRGDVTDVEVEQHEDLGDYVPRTWYAAVGDVKRTAGETGLARLERLLFDATLLRPGQLGWRGEGACVDRRFLGESLLNSATGHWLDMSPLADYYDGEYQTYRTPPIPYVPSEHGLVRQVNQICFDFTPSGPKFAGIAQRLGSQPSPKRRRRGRRRSSRA